MYMDVHVLGPGYACEKVQGNLIEWGISISLPSLCMKDSLSSIKSIVYVHPIVTTSLGRPLCCFLGELARGRERVFKISDWIIGYDTGAHGCDFGPGTGAARPGMSAGFGIAHEHCSVKIAPRFAKETGHHFQMLPRDQTTCHRYNRQSRLASCMHHFVVATLGAPHHKRSLSITLDRTELTLQDKNGGASTSKQ